MQDTYLSLPDGEQPRVIPAHTVLKLQPCYLVQQRALRRTHTPRTANSLSEPEGDHSVSSHEHPHNSTQDVLLDSSSIPSPFCLLFSFSGTVTFSESWSTSIACLFHQLHEHPPESHCTHAPIRESSTTDVLTRNPHVILLPHESTECQCLARSPVELLACFKARQTILDMALKTRVQVLNNHNRQLTEINEQWQERTKSAGNATLALPISCSSAVSTPVSGECCAAADPGQTYEPHWPSSMFALGV